MSSSLRASPWRWCGLAVVRVLSPYVDRVIVANSMQVKAIAHARIKTEEP
ncbi:hypothetical protein [Mesorhizobium sp.]|nr:hypothetical protein [Mesorhizobium sp.]